MRTTTRCLATWVRRADLGRTLSGQGSQGLGLGVPLPTQARLRSSPASRLRSRTRAHPSPLCPSAGIARALSASTKFLRTQIGTPFYMSPELCRDEACRPSTPRRRSTLLRPPAAAPEPSLVRRLRALFPHPLSPTFPPSPWQPYNERSDVWALGVVLYEMVRGAAQSPA